MDHEVLRRIADIDQMRAGLREIVERLPPDDVVELFRDCNLGRLPEPDTRMARVVGTLAAIALFDICQSRREE